MITNIQAIPIKEMSREEWAEERRKGLGGSEAGAVLGLNPWATPVDVWLNKTGRTSDIPDNENMRIGRDFEDYVAQRYTEDTGQKVRRYNYMLRAGVLVGNIDRLVHATNDTFPAFRETIKTTVGLECKTTRDPWEGGEVPAHIQAQVMHYMGLAPSLERFDVSGLFFSTRTRLTLPVFRCNSTIEEMQAVLVEWWARHVAGDTMPEAATEGDLKKLWAVSRGAEIPADDHLEAVHFELTGAKGAAKELAEKIKALELQIKLALGDADTLVNAKGAVLATWKTAKDSTKTDWEAVAKVLAGGEVPVELVERHTETKPGARTFLLKALKE